MLKKLSKRFTNYLAIGNLFEDIGVAFVISFLIIVFYSLYRQFLGIPFVELRPVISEDYLKFAGMFLLIGFSLFSFFCLVLNRPDILDLLLLVGSLTVSVGIVGFSPGAFSFCLILVVLMGMIFFFYFIHRERNLFRAFGKGHWLLMGFTVLIIFLIAALAFFKHWTFFSYDLDLGYFDQIFYSMTKSFRPLYTILGERINHFQNNHFSPIFYLLLPGYWVFPSAEYLILIQVVFVGLAVIPLYKLCETYRLEKKVILFVCTAFLLQPGIIGGQFYDFHENALLPFFLFGLLYFLRVRNKPGIFMTFILTLMIKEDVVLYLVAIGLFELLRPGGSKKTAVGMIAGSIVYFFLVSRFILDITFFHNRYENLIDSSAGGSYLDILKIFFTNPLYLFTQCFTAEKVFFLGLIFLPMALIPLSGLFHISEIPLFLPMIAINLLPSWRAQYSIEYQYNFGTIPLLILICVRFLASLSETRVRTALATLMTASALIFSVSFHIEKTNYLTYYRENQPELQAINDAIGKIPAEASVSAASHIVPHISARDEIYIFGAENDTDFVIADLRGGGVYIGDVYNEISYLSEIKRLLSEESFGVVDYWEKWFILLKKDYSGELDTKVIGDLSAGIKELQPLEK